MLGVGGCVAKRIRNKSRLKLFVWGLDAKTSHENELTNKAGD